MGHFFRFKRGYPVTIVSGRYNEYTGVVDSAAFQPRAMSFPDEYAPGFHIVLDGEPRKVVTVRLD